MTGQSADTQPFSCLNANRLLKTKKQRTAMQTSVPSQPNTLDGRVIFLGNPGVGKTCILLTAAGKPFPADFRDTQRIDYEILCIPSADRPAKSVGDLDRRLIFLDTAGQEEFRCLTSSYYRSADIQLIVFDITDKDSFTELEEHVSEASRYSTPSAVKILVANKLDLQLDRVVGDPEIDLFADRNDMEVVRYSAKTGEGRERLLALMERHLITTTWKTGDASFIKLNSMRAPKPRRRCQV